MADTDTFEGLGLRPELVEAAAEADFPRPSPLQSAAIPVLRRGGNAVLRASSGSGIVAAYGLALLDRLVNRDDQEGEERGPGGLILVPTRAMAGRIAESLMTFARAVDLRIMALAPGWPGIEREDTVDVIVASPADALEAVRAARLKLGSIATIVLSDADQQFELGAGDALDTLVDSLPSEAQRVVAGATYPDPVEDFIEARVRRPMHIPARPAAGKPAKPAGERGKLSYAIAADTAKRDLLATWLGSAAAADSTVVYCRTEAEAARLRDTLSLRGFPVANGTVNQGAAVMVRGRGASEEAADGSAGGAGGAAEGAGGTARVNGAVISFDVPFDRETLVNRHGSGGLVLVESRELAHLRQIAEDAGFETTAARLPERGRGPSEALDQYRERIRRAAGEEDLAAQLLVLDPLLNEFTAAELAAATSALLRRRTPEPTAAPPARAGRPSAAPAAETGAPPAWSRLFMSVGRRDDVRPGDIVGAITGEADVSGDQIGRIDINDNFTIVEVASKAAELVIAAMNGITMKRRALRVDYDRKPSRGAGRGRPQDRS